MGFKGKDVGPPIPLPPGESACHLLLKAQPRIFLTGQSLSLKIFS